MNSYIRQIQSNLRKTKGLIFLLRNIRVFKDESVEDEWTNEISRYSIYPGQFKWETTINGPIVYFSDVRLYEQFKDTAGININPNPQNISCNDQKRTERHTMVETFLVLSESKD